MTLTITNVEWVRDHQHRPVLRLNLDGHPAQIPSKQRQELLRRGIVQGVDFFRSERADQTASRFMRGAVEPGLPRARLAGCTDDPQVFALYEAMCRAIGAGTWQPGPQAPLAREGA